MKRPQTSGMNARVAIALVGDYDAAVAAHRAIPPALLRAAERIGTGVDARWLATADITGPEVVAGFDGIWSVPASPYRSMQGALLAIRLAREHGIAFLGTCGGFQHALVEYARHVLGWSDADHAETSPDAARAVVSPLSCALFGVEGTVRFHPGTLIAAAYGCPEAVETYQCRYGLNPRFRDALVAGPLREGASDASGEVRSVELDGHPFFVATLFQPERAALDGRDAPLVEAFVRAACLGAAQVEKKGPRVRAR